MEKERTAASQAATVEAMQQRLGRAETEMEVVKREHQGQIARLQADNQLLASLHRVLFQIPTILDTLIISIYFAVNHCTGTN